MAGRIEKVIERERGACGYWLFFMLYNPTYMAFFYTIFKLDKNLGKIILMTLYIVKIVSLPFLNQLRVMQA
jgi:hypothetical protein